MGEQTPDDEASVLIADADERARSALERVFEAAGYAVRVVGSGTEALGAVRAEVPVAAILDVALHDVSGYEICHTLRRRHGRDIAIILMSATRMESYDRVAGLLIGADDYVAKDTSPGEILARVRGLLEHTRRRHEAVLPELTTRETEVLRLFARGLAQDEIADRLFISPKTVGTHIENIMRKLGVRTRSQAVAVAYQEHLVDRR
jgi:DNA-binding NarL/FixJ family response regulator